MSEIWKEKNNVLTRSFGFTDFNEALDFVNKVGVIAENMQHHPDIYLHSYNQVQISLTTHDQGKITDKDYKVAEMIDKLLNV